MMAHRAHGHGWMVEHMSRCTHGLKALGSGGPGCSPAPDLTQLQQPSAYPRPIRWFSVRLSGSRGRRRRMQHGPARGMYSTMTAPCSGSQSGAVPVAVSGCSVQSPVPRGWLQRHGVAAGARSAAGKARSLRRASKVSRISSCGCVPPRPTPVPFAFERLAFARAIAKARSVGLVFL